MDTACFAAVTRRASLMTLGAAGLAGLACPVTADAKKSKHKKKGDATKRCRQQAGDWTIYVTAVCDGNPDCLEALSCADPLRSCNFSSFLDCLLD